MQPQWRLVELSHVIEAGITTYSGLPGPEVTNVRLERSADTSTLPTSAFGSHLLVQPRM